MQIKNMKFGQINGRGKKVGIAVSRFNQGITDGLLAAARTALARFGVKEGEIKILSIAGAMELPLALQKLAASNKYDCLVALGCVIRGETPHFDYVAKTAQEGVLRVALDYHIPIGFGVLTTENLTQAKKRLHVGAEAAAAALELALIKI